MEGDFLSLQLDRGFSRIHLQHATDELQTEMIAETSRKRRRLERDRRAIERPQPSLFISFNFHKVSKLLPTFYSAYDPTSTTHRHPQCHPPTAIHPQDHQIIPLRITKTEQIGHIPPSSFTLSQTPRVSRDIHTLVHGDYQRRGILVPVSEKTAFSLRHATPATIAFSVLTAVLAIRAEWA